MASDAAERAFAEGDLRQDGKRIHVWTDGDWILLARFDSEADATAGMKALTEPDWENANGE